MSESKKGRIVIAVFTIALVLVLGTAITYTWVLRNWTPSLNHSNMEIATSGSLVIQLEGDTSREVVDLNEVSGYDSFMFRQVSSQNGVDFYWPDFTDCSSVDDLDNAKLNLVTNAAGYYIDVDFSLTLDANVNEPKYVFFSPYTHIKNQDGYDTNAYKAMRVAVSYPGAETKIFGMVDDGGLISRVTPAAKSGIEKLGVDMHFSNQDLFKNQVVYSFANYLGGRTQQLVDSESDPDKTALTQNFTPVKSQTLFVLQPGETKKMNVKIWLEGGDANCLHEVAGNKLDLSIQFDSVVVPADQRDAGT